MLYSCQPGLLSPRWPAADQKSANKTLPFTAARGKKKHTWLRLTPGRPGACLPPPAASRGLPRPDLQNHPARMTPRTGREPTSSVCRVAWGFGSLIALFSFAVWCCLPVISGQCLLPQGASGRHWKICSLQRMAFDFMFFFFSLLFFSFQFH